MATVQFVYSSVQTMTVTNLHSLASSATAGWEGAVVNNTTNLYLDALVFVTLDFAATAPANDKAVYLLAYGGLESGTYTNNNNGVIDGTESAETFTNITSTGIALPRIGIVPYETSGEVISAGPFSVAAGFGGILPPYWGLAIINFSGAALAASGNAVKWVGIHALVA